MAVLTVFLFSFYRLVNQSRFKIYYLSALIFKLICGVLLGLLYTYHYESGDTFGYYYRASAIADQNWNMFWKAFVSPIDYMYARKIYFDRILALVLYVTKTNYWFVGLYYSFFSYVCALYLVRQISFWRPKWTQAAIFSLLFYPSIVFWSSGILKESLTFGAMMVLMGGYVKLRSGRKFYLFEGLWYVLSLVLLIILKYYVLAILIPLLSYLLVFRRMNRYTWLGGSLYRKSLFIAILISVPIILALRLLHYNLRTEVIISTLQITHDQILAITPDWNKVEVIRTSNLLLDYIVNAGYFVFSGIFRPLFPETFRFPNILSAIENLTLIAIIAWRLIKPVKIKVNPDLLAIAILVLTMSFFLTYSMPNLGALARFKVYYMPFLMMTILIGHPIWKKVEMLRRH